MTAVPSLKALVARACSSTAPLLHRFLDRELSREEIRQLRRHTVRCTSCRAHLLWMGFQSGVLRQLRSPEPRRLHALWRNRLHGKLLQTALHEQADRMVRWLVERLARSGSEGFAVARCPATESLQERASGGTSDLLALHSFRVLQRWLGFDTPVNLGTLQEEDHVLAAFEQQIGSWEPLRWLRFLLALRQGDRAQALRLRRSLTAGTPLSMRRALRRLWQGKPVVLPCLCQEHQDDERPMQVEG